MDQVRIGQFIAELRHEQKMTQAELGERLGLTNKTVSRWETGVYMPDVEKLQMLSGVFGVSINELLSGRRLSDEELRKRADENLVAAVREERFSLGERSRFWKSKWLAEHTAALIILAAVYTGAFFAAYFLGGELRGLLGMLLCLAGVCAYGFLRNRMAAYIESHLYAAEDKEKGND